MRGSAPRWPRLQYCYDEQQILCEYVNFLSGTAPFIAPSNPTPQPPVPTRLFGTHYCGPGGAGTPVNTLDVACQAHDACYDAHGLSVGSNFGFGLDHQKIMALKVAIKPCATLRLRRMISVPRGFSFTLCQCHMASARRCDIDTACESFIGRSHPWCASPAILGDPFVPPLQSSRGLAEPSLLGCGLHNMPLLVY